MYNFDKNVSNYFQSEEYTMASITKRIARHITLTKTSSEFLAENWLRKNIPNEAIISRIIWNISYSISDERCVMTFKPSIVIDHDISRLVRVFEYQNELTAAYTLTY